MKKSKIIILFLTATLFLNQPYAKASNVNEYANKVTKIIPKPVVTFFITTSEDDILITHSKKGDSSISYNAGEYDYVESKYGLSLEEKSTVSDNSSEIKISTSSLGDDIGILSVDGIGDSQTINGYSIPGVTSISAGDVVVSNGVSFEDIGISVSTRDGILIAVEGADTEITKQSNDTLAISGQDDNTPIELIISEEDSCNFVLKTLSGNVSISDVPNTEFCSISTMSGNIEISNSSLFNVLGCSTTSGDVSLNNIEKVNTFSGDTMSGNIYMNGLKPKKPFVKTLSGLIKR